MKQLLLVGSLACCMSAFSQTTLFQDDFETGGGNWTMNAGGSGNNIWTVNNEYVGFSPFINDTPNQPGGITNSPNSSYMHIHNTDACVGLSVCNASFDTGSPSNQVTTLTNPIDATGYNTVTLSFYYLCAGSTGSAYGTIEYSTDGGGTWTPTGTSYVNVSTWTQTSVTLPAWNNATSLKFRFRWQNSAVGNDPAFAIDQLSVTGIAGSFASITTNAINAATWCFNTAANVTVNFDVTGTVNAGNIYTAQLSNAAGSFASPTSIGSLTSSASGALSINGVIPGGTPAGSGYRIRVVASDPVTTGTDNGTNLSIFAQPTITIIGNPADGIICNGETITMLGSGGVSYVWTPNATIDFPTQAQVIATPTATTLYTTVGTDVNGCTNTATFNVTVQNCADITENEAGLFSLYPNPATDVVSVQSATETSIQGLELLDQNGRVIRATSGNVTMSVADLATGSYFIRVIHETGMSTLRFTKK
jgi:hypothetical protein